MIKKSQVGIFLLLGAVLALVSIIIILQPEKPSQLQLSGHVQFDPEFYFFEQCLQDRALEAVHQIALGGGYLNVSPPSLQGLLFSIPFYILEGRNFMPSIGDVEKELALAMEANAARCETQLQEQFVGLKIEFERAIVAVTMQSSLVVFFLEYPITIEKAGTMSQRSNFVINVEKPLMEMYNSAAEFTLANIRTPEGMCITCLTDVMEQHALKADVDYFGEVAIISMKKGEGEEALEWVFANEYQ